MKEFPGLHTYFHLPTTGNKYNCTGLCNNDIENTCTKINPSTTVLILHIVNSHYFDMYDIMHLNYLNKLVVLAEITRTLQQMENICED